MAIAFHLNVYETLPTNIFKIVNPFWDVAMWTYSNFYDMHKACLSLSQTNTIMKRGGGYETSPQTGELLVIGIC